MLSGAFGNWIKTLAERDFDETFLSLLRASGFYDVHFTHGSHEYGKDVIAKRGDPPVQYAFQCKAGDIGGPEWDKIFSQLFELTRTGLVHPNFDATLPCEFVVATTGRLKGRAMASAEQFKTHVESTPGRRFTFWGERNLLDMLEGQGPGALPPGPGVLPVLGRIAAGTLEEREIEKLTAPLLPQPGAPEKALFRSILDNTIVSAALAKAGLPFHALTAALNEVRIVACRAHDVASAAALLPEAMTRYRSMGDSLLGVILADPENSRRWLDWCGGMVGKILAYPAVCLRTAEFLGLTALGGSEDAVQRVEKLRCVVAKQPGVSRPISDRYAASLPPVVIALAKHGHKKETASLLKATTGWLCDRYEHSEFGLADAGAGPKEEAETLLGAPFEFVNLVQRRESLLAVALADLAHAFAPALYPDIINELLAVKIVPAAPHALDEPAAYRVGTGSIAPMLNIAYPYQATHGPLAHQTVQGPRFLERVGYWQGLLAISCLTRDRLFSDCYPRLAEVA